MECRAKPTARTVIWSLWLLVFTMSMPNGIAMPRSKVLACHPSWSFHYDGQYGGNIRYDESPNPSLCYDNSMVFSASTEQAKPSCVEQIGHSCELLAAEGAANLTTAELKQLYPRVTPRRGLAEEVWERSKAPNGKVYDPTGVEIKPGDYWELGQTPGNQIPDARLRAAQEGWDRATWRQYQNDPDIYRPELKPTNRSHAHESDW